MKKLLFILLSIIAFASCEKEEQELKNTFEAAPVFSTSFEEYVFGAETKTYVDENVKLLWHKEDELSIFTSTLNQKFIFDGETGHNSGTFTMASNGGQFGTGNEIKRNYAVYPYSSSIKLSNSEVFTVTLPDVQAYAVNSFGRGANTMVAATSGLNDYFLPFKNVGGYLILKLYAEDVTVKSICIAGNNSEKLSGEATITAVHGSFPVVDMADTATETIKIDCGSQGVKLSTSKDEPTQFWFVIPPTTFEEGFTVTITDINGCTMTKCTSKSLVIERNSVTSMSALDVMTLPCTIPSNEIWYTSTDGEIVVPNENAEFGANIVSNTYENGKGVIVFDEQLTTIGNYAFYDCSSLYSMMLPDGIIEIGPLAFAKCTNLISINIPETVTILGNGNNPFSGCMNLIFSGKYATEDGKSLIKDGLLVSFCPGTDAPTSYSIPKGVTTIGRQAFQFCSNLTSVDIPDGVTDIMMYAFYGCTSLTTIDIPESVTFFDVENPFILCTNLSFTGKYASTDGNCLIQDGGIISFCPGTTDPIEYNIPDGVTTIRGSAFSNCSNLTSVNIPEGVINIYSWAFDGCTNLRTVNIPQSVSFMGTAAFQGCINLSDVYCYPTTPPALNGTSVFHSNAFGRLIHVPSASIDAYKTATNWSEYENDIIGDLDKPLSNQIWYTSTNGQIVEPYKDDAFGATISSNVYKNGKGIITFDQPVTKIGIQAFATRSSLSSVVLPEGITQIDANAFNSCVNLKSIVLPDGITHIGGGAFTNCIGLTSIDIPESVISLDYNPFNKCLNLTFEGKFASADGRCLIKDGILVSFCPGTLELVTYSVPQGVTSIGEYAFYECENLTTITLSDEVTSIDEFAFCNCTGLLTINISDKVTSIEKCAFNDCVSLKSVTIPQSVTTIGESAFSGSGILSLVIPDNVTSIGEDAFYNCVNLTDLTLGKGISIIEKGTFHSCGLISLVIPDNVISIGSGAFEDCVNLVNLTIGEGVTTMQGSVFNRCSSLKNVYCNASTPPVLNINVFDGNAPDRLIHVPAASVDAYKIKWSAYADEIVGDLDV